MNKMVHVLAAGMLVAASVFAEEAKCAAGCCAKGAAGCWAMQRGGAFWVGVCDKNGAKASILWGGGSPTVQYDVAIDGQKAVMKQLVHGDNDPEKKRERVSTLTADGDKGELVCEITDGNGKVHQTEKFGLKRIPPPGPKPDLAALKFGEPVDLLKDGLDGWKSMNPNAHFGWTVKDGVLSNRIKRNAEGKPEGGNANLMTKRADFTDFKLDYEVRVLPGCNSGVYLRGLYELQVIDSYGKGPDCHNMAAVYGRITPKVAAEKPANEWQTVNAVLANRHITVRLNGQLIIDNEPVFGCTGGAITSDEFVPGPMYLQGDHSDADFRNMILTPIVK